MLIFYMLKSPNNLWEGNYKVTNPFKLLGKILVYFYIRSI